MVDDPKTVFMKNGALKVVSTNKCLVEEIPLQVNGNVASVDLLMAQRVFLILVWLGKGKSNKHIEPEKNA